ncbi:hypothetical protein EYR40_001682 [Pleurotus pulmonarius]|nr:hypothetical protein EYR40_001682 [Pleurotus pulmonarius]
MADITSPRRPLTAAKYFISGLYNSATMRSVVREELAGKVSKDDSSVFRRLEIDQVSDEFVESCFELSITQHRGLFDELDEVVAAAAQARTKTVYHDAQRAKGYSWEEEEMYPLLASPQIVYLFCELKVTRNIKIAANMQLKGAEYTTGFPKVTPDGTGSRVLECDSWMDVDWFVQVKPTESQGLATEDAPISEVVCQAADYARLHMSCRPFQLFSVGLLIFGRKFMVSILDRDGVLLSPIFDFCDAGEGFRTFIRVIRRLVSLSDIELGCDPTVQPLSPSSGLHAAVRELAISRGLSPDFPPYVVLCPREYSTTVNGVTSAKWEQNAWLTVGPPIWVSLSLIGRGTNIWPVVPLIWNSGKYTIGDDAPLSILKNAWRNSDRTGEASVYGSLNAPPPGVARFLQGGDARFDSETDIPISVHNLRRQYPYGAWLHRVTTNAVANAPSGPGTGTAVLHRLILQTIGRPLWQFTSYLELLKAFRAAIVGHQRLVAYGILHRDISAGNIMISADDNPAEGEEGFLMDLEFARIDEIVHVTKVPGGPQHTTWSAPKRGIQMTGTVQFMAREILDSIVQNKPIEHTESHDLESFAWVFAYVVFRRLLHDSDGEKKTKFSEEDRIAIQKSYEQSFGALKLDTVLTQREALKPFKIAGTRIERLLPKAITGFMVILGAQVAMNYVVDAADLFGPHFRALRASLPSQTNMTHSHLIQLIDAAIQTISIGRPLWHFASYLELLKAFRAAIVAYDVECPKVGHPDDRTIYLFPTEASSDVDQTQASVQFMAREILKSIIDDKPIEHTESHDLESFAWVFAYVVLRRLLRDSGDETNSTMEKDARVAVEMVYEQTFGALDLDIVWTQRCSLLVFDFGWNDIEGLLPAAISQFMTVLGVLVGANHAAARPPAPRISDPMLPQAPRERMTHDKLVYFIDKSVASLEEEMQVG